MKKITEIIKTVKSDLESEKRIIKPIGIDPKDQALLFKTIAGEDYLIDDTNKEQINYMCSYFTRQLTALELNKGLLLVGGVGTGKTRLMKIFKKFAYYLNATSFKIVSSREIIRNYRNNGEKGITEYLLNESSNEHSIMIPKPLNICIDDIGIEQDESVHFGERSNVIHELILDRYDILMNHNKITHATTNLNTTDLKSKYLERISSRFKEMFNIIILDGNDRRN